MASSSLCVMFSARRALILSVAISCMLSSVSGYLTVMKGSLQVIAPAFATSKCQHIPAARKAKTVSHMRDLCVYLELTIDRYQTLRMQLGREVSDKGMQGYAGQVHDTMRLQLSRWLTRQVCAVRFKSRRLYCIWTSSVLPYGGWNPF